MGAGRAGRSVSEELELDLHRYRLMNDDAAAADVPDNAWNYNQQKHGARVADVFRSSDAGVKSVQPCSFL